MLGCDRLLHNGRCWGVPKAFKTGMNCLMVRAGVTGPHNPCRQLPCLLKDPLPVPLGLLAHLPVFSGPREIFSAPLGLYFLFSKKVLAGHKGQVTCSRSTSWCPVMSVSGCHFCAAASEPGAGLALPRTGRLLSVLEVVCSLDQGT